MKKELLQKYLFVFIFFAVCMIVRRWFEWGVIALFLGGALGVVLPYVDHLIYVFVLRPNSEVSQGIRTLLVQKKYAAVADSFAGVQGRRTRYIFHTAHFNLLFLLLSFLVLTSSGGLFGRGIVIGFALSVLITQYYDYAELGGLDHWFEKLNLYLDKKQQGWYLAINLLVLLIFGFFI